MGWKIFSIVLEESKGVTLWLKPLWLMLLLLLLLILLLWLLPGMTTLSTTILVSLGEVGSHSPLYVVLTCVVCSMLVCVQHVVLD